MAKKKSTTKPSPRGNSGKAKKNAASKSAKTASSSPKKKASSVKKSQTASLAGKAQKSSGKKSTSQKTAAKKTVSRKGAAVEKKSANLSAQSNQSVAKKNGTPEKVKVAGTAAKAVSSVEDRVSNRVKPRRKTRLSDGDLEMFRDMLLAKRAELVGDMTQLQDEALGRNRSDSAGDVSSMPTHMADLGSDNWEQEFTLGLIENERLLIREIDEALDRIRDRTYGICLATNKIIRKARLRANPGRNTASNMRGSANSDLFDNDWRTYGILDGGRIERGRSMV